jgi:hypothetical protein
MIYYLEYVLSYSTTVHHMLKFDAKLKGPAVSLDKCKNFWIFRFMESKTRRKIIFLFAVGTKKAKKNIIRLIVIYCSWWDSISDDVRAA